MNAKEAREKAMQYCTRREYCRKEIYSKVVSWGCTPAEAAETVDFLIAHQFISDRRYAAAFTKDKLRFNKWGRVKIAIMLRNQNIEQPVIAEVFDEIDHEEYRKILQNELQKKYKAVSGSTFEVKAKLFRFAAGRGFEPDIVNRIITEITGKTSGSRNSFEYFYEE